jgi:hypothetical protein
LETISRTSQSEVAAVDRSPIGRDRVALGWLWILQGPAFECGGRPSMSCQLKRKRAGSRAGRGARNPTEARSIGCQAFYSLLLEPPVHASCPAAIGVELRPWRADFHFGPEHLQQYHRVENTSCHVVCCCTLVLLFTPHNIPLRILIPRHATYMSR